MKKTFTHLLLVCIALAGFVSKARADHMVGSDIYWKCLGPDSFAITIVDYRDCNGIAFVNSPFVLTPVGSCPGVTAQTVSGGSSGGKDITPVCHNSCDRCTDASCEFAYGIQQYFITATVVLPKGCCDYQISWEQCCRSAGITTGATWADYYITSQMSRCTFGYCDNSPYFTNPPVAVYCTNQCVVYNPGADDVDRDPNTGLPDSLSYALTQPLTGSGSYTPWTGGYSYLQPLDYSGFPYDPNGVWNPPSVCNGFHVDSVTGEIDFKAVKTDVTVIALAVSEYRKDSLGVYEKIGEIRRDMQIIIIDCPANHPPIISGINGGTTSSIKICADKQTCFTIKAFDLDVKDTDKMAWNNPGTMSGASFTVAKDGKKWPTGTFCWSPGDKDIRSYPYTFIVTATDNACPVPGRADRAFNIYVIASPKATYSAILQNCGVVNFSAGVSPESTTPITSYVWTGQGSPGYGPMYITGAKGSYKYTRPGTYTYTLAVTGPNKCTRNYTDSIKIPPYVQISLPPDTTVCANASAITINATVTDAKAPSSINWDHSTATGTSITAKITRDTVFVVHIKDGTGCTNFDSMHVHMQALPQPNIGPDKRGCWGHTVMLTDGMGKTMPYAAWTHIKGKDTIANYLHGDTIFVQDSGIYTVTVEDSFGCPGSASVNVFFNPYVKANNGTKDVCFENSIVLHAGIGGSGASYQWKDKVHNKVVGTDSTYTESNIVAPTSAYQIIITQSQHGVTCADTGEIDVHMHPIPTPQLRKLFPPKCISDPPLEISTIPPPPMVDASHLGGTWYYPKNPAAVTNGYIFPSTMGRTDNDTTLGYIHYLYRDQYGCTSDDSARIVITPKPQVSAGPDAVVCRATGMYLLSNKYAGPAPGSWTPLTGNNLTRSAPTPKAAIVTRNDSVFFDPSKVATDTVYGCIYYHIDGASAGKSPCSNTDTVFLTVKTNPTIVFTPVDSQCNNAGPVALQVTPQGGTFSFLDNTDKRALVFDVPSNTYYFYPDSTTGGYHKLLYTAYADEDRKLCGTQDSEQVYVAQEPIGNDFWTADHSLQYCVSHSAIGLQNTPITGTGVGPGTFFAPNNPAMVYQSGSKWFFDPSKADTTDSIKNVITYRLYYNFGKCHIDISHSIGVDGRPYVKILSSPQVCDGQTSFQVYAESKNATKLTWTSDGGNNQFKDINNSKDSVTFFPSQQQLQSHYFNVYLTGSNHGVCVASHDKDSFNIYFRPYVSFSSARQNCEPFKVQFSDTANLPGKGNGDGIKSYDWDFGDGSTHDSFPNPTHTYVVKNGQSSQQYTVKFTATSTQGCTSDTIKQNWITVNASPKPGITANPQITTIALPQVQFDVNEPLSKGIDFTDPKTTYRWNFGDSSKQYAYIKSPQYTYGDTGKFRVTLQVVSKGCIGDSSLQVYIQPELIIYIPNAFTPGGMHGRGKGNEPNYFSENVNQTFQPVISAYASFEMSIYNRWGELLYTTTNPQKGWDGRYEGRRPLEDVYVYVIKATGYSGKAYTFTGTVTLLE